MKHVIISLLIALTGWSAVEHGDFIKLDNESPHEVVLFNLQDIGTVAEIRTEKHCSLVTYFGHKYLGPCDTTKKAKKEKK